MVIRGTSAGFAGIPVIVWNRTMEATRDPGAARRWPGLRPMRRGGPGSWSPLFGALGQRTIWVGETGAGTRLKLVNNTWLAFANEAVAASVALAHRLGLETGTVLEALGGGPLVSPWQAAKLERIASGEFSAQFALSLALKDVHLALQAAGDARFTALTSLASEWQQAVDHGLGEQDLTVVTRVIEQQGVKRKPLRSNSVVSGPEATRRSTSLVSTASRASYRTEHTHVASRAGTRAARIYRRAA